MFIVCQKRPVLSLSEMGHEDQRSFVWNARGARRRPHVKRGQTERLSIDPSVSSTTTSHYLCGRASPIDASFNL